MNEVASTVHDWWGLVGLAMLAISGMGIAWITANGAKRTATHIKGQVDEVREQVQNSHSTNLRDDIDDVKQIATEVKNYLRSQGRDIAGLREEIGEMREEVRDERHDRIDLERRIAGFVKREHPGAPPV